MKMRQSLQCFSVVERERDRARAVAVIVLCVCECVRVAAFYSLLDACLSFLIFNFR